MRRTELMLREAIDNLADSFILYDSDQRVVLTNRRFHEILPFHPGQDEVIGKTMRELIEASVANNAITDPRVWQDSARFVDPFIAERMAHRPPVREDTWPDARRALVQDQHIRSAPVVSFHIHIYAAHQSELRHNQQT